MGRRPHAGSHARPPLPLRPGRRRAAVGRSRAADDHAAHLRHRRRPRPAQRVLRRRSRRSPSSTASPSCCLPTATPSTTSAAGSRTSSATTRSGSHGFVKPPTSSGEATVEQLSQRLFRERSWGPMAESETYAHLEHLRLSGQATRRRTRRHAALLTRLKLARCDKYSVDGVTAA